jgi:hypothetical protein
MHAAWRKMKLFFLLAAIALPATGFAQAPAADEHAAPSQWDDWVSVEAPSRPEGDLYSFQGRKGEWFHFTLVLPGIEGKLSVRDPQGELLAEETGSGQVQISRQFPADGQYLVRVRTSSKYVLMPQLRGVFDSTGRSHVIMAADSEWGPYGWLRAKVYERVDGTRLRWTWAEFNKSILEERLRGDEVVEKHLITQGEYANELLMDGRRIGRLSRYGDHVDWEASGPEGRAFGLSLQEDERLRWETMARDDARTVDATEFLRAVDKPEDH